MKKMLSVMLALCLVLVLGACSQDDNVYESGEDEDVVEEEYSEEESDSGDVQELVSRGTWDTEDANGYKVHGEIETTGLIRASD